MAVWLSTKLARLDLVLVSPYLRAEQTWQDCQAALPKVKKMICEEGLTPYGDSEQVATYLRALISIEHPQSVLVVSHLPLVNYLAAEFDHTARSLSFSTSAICQIEFDPFTETAKVVDFKTVSSL